MPICKKHQQEMAPSNYGGFYCTAKELDEFGQEQYDINNKVLRCRYRLKGPVAPARSAAPSRPAAAVAATPPVVPPRSDGHVRLEAMIAAMIGASIIYMGKGDGAVAQVAHAANTFYENLLKPVVTGEAPKQVEPDTDDIPF